MVSNVDETKPDAVDPTTVSVRDNMTIIADEITALQADKASLADLASTTDATLGDAMVGVLNTATGSVATTQHEVNERTKSVFDFMTAAEIADVVAGTLLVDVTTALALAATWITSYNTLRFPAGQYLVTAAIDFKAKANINLIADRRNTWIMANHSGVAIFDLLNESFQTGGSTYRGVVIDGFNFFSATTSSSLPARGLGMRNAPESIVRHCSFIGCATVDHVLMEECWSSEFRSNYISVDENSTAIQGAPYNTASGGTGLNIGQDSHEIAVEDNRIRTGSPGMKYDGGDSSRIVGNSIEGNQTNGIELANSNTSLLIQSNYFEGGPQPFDIQYKLAATNVAHEISNNYFHATGGIQFENNVAMSGMRILNNSFISSTTGIDIGTQPTSKYQLFCKGNVFDDVATPYVLEPADIKVLGINWPNNRMGFDDTHTGTTGGPEIKRNTTPLTTTGTVFDTFAGTGSSSDASVNINGILAYDLAGTSAWTTNVDYRFDATLQGEYITICMTLASSAGTNFTITVDDGVLPTVFTVNSAVAGAAAVDCLLYYRVAPTAVRCRIRILVGSVTIQALVPSVRLGLHDDLFYRDIR